jgi:hypothetical protein
LVRRSPHDWCDVYQRDDNCTSQPCKHLHPGHYRITVRDLKRHGKSVVLAHTTLTVS